MRTLIFLSISSLFLVLFFSCKKPGKVGNDESGDAVPQVLTTRVRIGKISEMTELNATSRYLKEHLINAPVSGYITKANCLTGTVVREGAPLFEIKTREARALGQTPENITGKLDFKGITEIKANLSGYIANVFHQEGDFVAEGESLVSLKETSSLVFVLDLPYEWNRHISNNKQVSLGLPDSRILRGIVENISPQVDEISQTQKVYVKLLSQEIIPEGLIAKIFLPLKVRANVQVLPRRAVLSNETETIFWLMKMAGDSMAVRVDVEPGLKNRDSLEIRSPLFSAEEEILISGNYAVPDTIKVKVIK
jgi:multidrug efflux pump subunit AcrA (membrane-fusion protein)